LRGLDSVGDLDDASRSLVEIRVVVNFMRGMARRALKA
jgi:hypothetical protein